MDDPARTNGAAALRIAEGDAAALRAQIEATRAELGDTVAALAVKADVKQQARDRIDHVKRQVAGKGAQLRERARTTSPDTVTHTTRTLADRARAHPLPVAVAAAFALGFALGRLTRR